MAVEGLYATVGARDLDAAGRFYDAALATIGWRLHTAYEGWRGYSEGGRGDGFVLWVCLPFDGQAASAGNGAMFGLNVTTRAEVAAFYAAGMSTGGSDEGGPGLRPDYGPNWYAAYLRDPCGNKIGIVCNRDGA